MEGDVTPESFDDSNVSNNGPQRIVVHTPGGLSAHELHSAAVHAFSVKSPGGTSCITRWLDNLMADDALDEESTQAELEAFGVQILWGTYSGLQETTVVLKDFTHVVPKLLVVVVKINEHPVHWGILCSQLWQTS